jgi:hypothetical protein
MAEQRGVQHGNAEASRGAPDDTPGGQPSDTREAQEAHGGSMAPGLVDETGHLIAEPPAQST